MNFLYEYQKMFTFLILLIFLIILQVITGSNLSEWIRIVFEILSVLIGAGVVKNSVLRTSDRNFLNNNVTPEVDPPYDGEPLVERPEIDHGDTF